MMKATQVRETFLEYFEVRGHKRVRSSSLVPQDDPTLLFTNAGMNQFKDVFLGLEKRGYRRAATSQKCMRVSGKHNDLEEVGRTPRHHTFFEMLGNFSFGDYFKKEAIEFGWELCTDVYGLDPDRLIATVYRDDDEAYDLWRNHIGIPPDRLFRLGEADNFWSMGETGPCGPCSEILCDLTGEGDGDPESDPDRFFEIWNLVFMQFNRDQDGVQHPLPSPSIDTGMGLERITCLVQGVGSNYDTDLFSPIIAEASRLTGVAYGRDAAADVSLRILADHSRACAFLINDGVAPSNEGRGYVLRKILRRGIRHAKMLGRKEPLIYTLTALVAHLMEDAFPELAESRDYAARIVKNEEEKFSATLDYGLSRLDDIISSLPEKGGRRIPGQEIFKLYDTFGFPLDLAREIAVERDLELDEEGFRDEMEKQRTRARASWKGSHSAASPTHEKLAGRFATGFTGYERIEDVSGKVLAILKDDEEVEVLRQGETGDLILDQTPFYAEAGGQVSDRGAIETDTAHAVVQQVSNPLSGLRLHRVDLVKGELHAGESIVSRVNVEDRLATQRNHTATHLLHAALREVLGPHVKQSGSLVAPDRLRFDFTHYKAVDTQELREIEDLVNRKIRENLGLTTDVTDLDDAISRGAMALFGEKYSQKVRVVQIPGFSMELCGGTHVSRTGDIGLFKVVHESSISAGTRRVEAATGEAALDRFFAGDDIMELLSSELHVKRTDLASSIEKLTRNLKSAQKKVEALQLKIAQTESSNALSDARVINGIKVLSQKVANLDRNALRQLADRLRNELGSGVVVLGTPTNGKAALVAMVSSDLTSRLRAGDLIREIAPSIGGGGGGRPEMAEAGGKNPAGLPEALDRVFGFVEENSDPA